MSFASGNQSGYGTLFVTNDEKSPSGYTIVNPGNGYTTSPIGPTNLQLASGSWNGGGTCSNLQGTITTGYHIASITVTAGGSGYTSDPTVTITGGVGSTSQPTASVTRAFPVSLDHYHERWKRLYVDADHELERRWWQRGYGNRTHHDDEHNGLSRNRGKRYRWRKRIHRTTCRDFQWRRWFWSYRERKYRCWYSNNLPCGISHGQYRRHGLQSDVPADNHV